MKHVICCVRNHRGIGKVEREIRTINERLRTNKSILVSNDKSGIKVGINVEYQTFYSHYDRKKKTMESWQSQGKRTRPKYTEVRNA